MGQHQDNLNITKQQLLVMFPTAKWFRKIQVVRSFVVSIEWVDGWVAGPGWCVGVM